MDVNPTLPERMTAAQRRQEVAQLLARGIARLHLPQSTIPKNSKTENQFALAIPPEGSVHAVSNHLYSKEIA